MEIVVLNTLKQLLKLQGCNFTKTYSTVDVFLGIFQRTPLNIYFWSFIYKSYLGPFQSSVMTLFVKIGNSGQKLPISIKKSMKEVWQGPR